MLIADVELCEEALMLKLASESSFCSREFHLPRPGSSLESLEKVGLSTSLSWKTNDFCSYKLPYSSVSFFFEVYGTLSWESILQSVSRILSDDDTCLQELSDASLDKFRDVFLIPSDAEYS